VQEERWRREQERKQQLLAKQNSASPTVVVGHWQLMLANFDLNNKQGVSEKSV